MIDQHLSEDLLFRFLHNRASREESMVVVRHLLRGCTDCRQRAAAGADIDPLYVFPDLFGAGVEDGDDRYAEAFDRWIQVLESDDPHAAQRSVPP